MPDGTRLTGVAGAVALAASHLAQRQGDDGAWQGEVVWCPIITAEVVLLDKAIARPIAEERRRLILRHFEVTQCPDGGWGLHPQSTSYLFVTTLVYVAARLLGQPADAELLKPARRWLAGQPGGIWSLPQWGKNWLALLGLYDRRGLNPCPPELFMLPHWLPGAPTRLYCHTRQIYLGIAYLLGSGFVADLEPIAASLRSELCPTDDGGAASHRHDLAATDAYIRPGRALRFAYDAADRLGTLWRRIPGSKALRRRALDACYAQILYEQRVTRHQGLSPINGILDTLAICSREPCSTTAIASREGIEAWCWQDEAEGLRYAGARSTTWDTSFVIHALLELPELGTVTTQALRRAYRRLAAMQITEELPDGPRHGRDPIRGGWCFGEDTHRWPVSDCTAEAVSALLSCHAVPDLIPGDDRLSPDRLDAAAAFILQRQNRDGGFGTYERRRGGGLVERLNPSEMFGQCMTELSYVECTASAIGALRRVLGAGLARDDAAVRRAIRRGAALLLARQRRDGAWPGFWGINFIYGTNFAVAGLRAAALPRAHPALQRAHAWLRSIQHPDGGWGEHFSGCLTGRYVDNVSSLVISTAWAVLALLEIEEEPSEAARRGIEWLLGHQEAAGGWPHDGVNGVFFGTAMLDYRLYNAYFPAWALARFEARQHALR